MMLHDCWRVIREKAASRHLWEVGFFYRLFVCPVLQFSEEDSTGAVNENH